MENKEKRITMLTNCLLYLQKIRNEYRPSSPAWVLIHAAQEHIKGLHHLEAQTNFDEETLGAETENE